MKTQLSENFSGPVAPPASLNRRHFLSKTLAMAAVAPLIGSNAGTAAEAVSTPSAHKIKLGVVGCGGRGCWIANLFKRHGGYEMWGVADYFQY